MRRLSCVAIVVLLASAAFGQEDAPGVPGLGEPFAPGRLVRGQTSRRILHFTFDDGPDPRTTPALLDALDAAGLAATFFFSASRFAGASPRSARARELAREVRRRGHAIGSHSVDHVRMRALPPARLRQQLDENDRLFTEVFGARTYLFRPPWGSHGPELDRLLQERGMTTVLWNIGSADWVLRSADALLRTFLRGLSYRERTQGVRGGIVLMHDTHPWTVEAFPRIVAALRARNCELLATGEDLYDLLPDLRLFDLEPGALRATVDLRQAALRQAETRRCAQAPP